jgi:hypothetical protein
MPNRLTNIRVDEISSVDKGAGRGVKVLLTKRDDEKGEPSMSETEPFNFRAAVASLRKQGMHPSRAIDLAGTYLVNEVRKAASAALISDDTSPEYGPDDDIDEQVKRMMDKDKLTRDQAITRVHRAEVARKRGI